MFQSPGPVKVSFGGAEFTATDVQVTILRPSAPDSDGDIIITE